MRILLDQSLATIKHGGGIPFDTRYMFKILSRVQNAEVTPLFYDPGNATLLHTFLKGRMISRSDKLENQSLFIEALVSHYAPWSKFRLLKLIQYFRYYYRIFFSRSTQTEVLDTTYLEEVIWRNFLLESLTIKDMEELFHKHTYLLSNLSNLTMMTRASLKLPQPLLNTKEFDFAIFEDSRPVKISRNTQKIIRYHDLIPVIRPDLIGNARNFIKWHHLGIKGCSHDSIYVCNSEPTRKDLVDVYPQLENRSVTIPYVLPSYFYPDPNRKHLTRIFQLRESRAAGISHPRKSLLVSKTPYLLCLATIEPRKNHLGIIRAFEILKTRWKKPFRLVFVGNLGWSYETILTAMKPLIKRGDLIHLEGTTIDEHRLLYSNAFVSVFPSYYEGFGLPPAESLNCDTPVVVSDIPAHKWVLGNAGTYCNPYAANTIADAIEKLAFSRNASKYRKDVISNWKNRSDKYSLDRVVNMWEELFEQCKVNPKF